MLTTNLTVQLGLKTSGNEIKVRLEAAGEVSDANPWTVQDFLSWYSPTFEHEMRAAGVRVDADSFGEEGSPFSGAWVYSRVSTYTLKRLYNTRPAAAATPGGAGELLHGAPHPLCN